MLNDSDAGMKLEFTLLVVDDQPNSIIESIYLLQDHLRSKGFSLRQETAEDFSVKGLSELTRSEGKDYDLVIVDYHLGQDADGATATVQLRRDLRYTEMVFYSSDSTIDLLAKLASQSVEGVFVAQRAELGAKLTGLADTVIGKAIDLNHMRGIAMAEVAELDVLMEETLVRAFQPTKQQFVAAKQRTTQKLREKMDSDSEELEQRLDGGSLSALVKDSRLFNSNQKYMAVKRVARALRPHPSDELRILNSYVVDIIKKRNMLAHAKEYTSEDGKIVLRSITSNVEEVIDDTWMADFRMKLIKHGDALSDVCKAIDRHVADASAEVASNPQKL